MGPIEKLSHKAEIFIQKILIAYFEDRNLPLLLTMCSQTITWFGTGKHEVCRNYDDAINLLSTELSTWDGNFKIINQNVKSIALSNNSFLFYGELETVEDGLNTILVPMYLRFTIICGLEDNDFKIQHAHMSVPNEAQDDGNFIHKSAILNYDKLLEEKLLERTTMLKEKMSELETLNNNILGGVEICNYNDAFTIKYISNGFTQITGYTLDEIKDLLDGNHINLLYEPDRHLLGFEIPKQLKENNYFSLEYRLVRKDGTVIWVMDKGVLLERKNGVLDIQCILTDITKQKEIEESYCLSEKRYSMAMQLSNVTMFEYDIVTKEFLFFENISKMYGIPNIVPNGVETFIAQGIIEPSSVDTYREMYKKIHLGEPTASCYIKTRDIDNIVHNFELTLTTIYNNDNIPIRAIGVRKDASQIMALQKENEFNKNLIVDKILMFEADITNNKLYYVNDLWIFKIEEKISSNTTFHEFIDIFTKALVHIDSISDLYKHLSLENIKVLLSRGENIISFDYKLKAVSNAIFDWHKATVNIIKDATTDEITIRFYDSNINEFKLKEQRASEEKRLYDSMITKAILAYDVNLTKNLAINGHEKWETLYEIKKSQNYTDMIHNFSQKVIHIDDRENFLHIFDRDLVLKKFELGENLFICDYRKIYNKNIYHWVRCTLHLYEDPQTGDVKGFSYVEDIDEQKSKELELKYNAEHDIMTSIYNKSTTEQKISEYFSSFKGKLGSHALFIVDIDYFKYVNDTFGHLFGDDVIKEIASNLNSLFRDNDIVGRIGGDEFCILMKNVDNDIIVERKAIEICDIIRKTYEKDGKSTNTSASIGIAFFNKNGTTFEELYKCADSMLYIAKQEGRNRFKF